MPQGSSAVRPTNGLYLFFFTIAECTVNKLLMMDRQTVQNMQSFTTKWIYEISAPSWFYHKEVKTLLFCLLSRGCLWKYAQQYTTTDSAWSCGRWHWVVGWLAPCVLEDYTTFMEPLSLQNEGNMVFWNIMNLSPNDTASFPRWF